MCSIAGLLHKHDQHAGLGMTTGEALTVMLHATVHRGPDSAGWALYKEPHDGELRLRFFVGEGEAGQDDIAAIGKCLAEHGAEIVQSDTMGCTYGARIAYGGDIQELLAVVSRVAEVVSIGSRLDILKDVGKPYELAPGTELPSTTGTTASVTPDWPPSPAYIPIPLIPSGRRVLPISAPSTMVRSPTTGSCDAVWSARVCCSRPTTTPSSSPCTWPTE